METSATDVPLQHKPRVIWPEDRLMWQYFKKHPEARLIPYDLNSFKPPFVKRFALKQYQLMQQGMTREQAYEDVTKVMKPEKDVSLRCDAHALRRRHHYQRRSAIGHPRARDCRAGC